MVWQWHEEWETSYCSYRKRGRGLAIVGLGVDEFDTCVALVLCEACVFNC